MFGSQLPTWKQLLYSNKSDKEASYWDDINTIWTAQSSCSINAILRAYKKSNNKEIVNIWLPDFFCNQTINFFLEEWMNIIYFPINKSLDPDWKTIKDMSKKSKPELFIFVHYFGVYHDINLARNFCNGCDCILIEDCAHILYNSGEFGKKGDFVIYSPHKILPVPNGAVINFNHYVEKKGIDSLVLNLKKEISEVSIIPNEKKWIIKKIVQKLSRLHKKSHYKIETHYGTDEGIKKKIFGVSNGSYKTLCEYDYKKLKEVAYIRRDNLSIMNYIISQICPNIIPLLDEKVYCPYIAAYSLENVENREEVMRNIKNKGIMILFWPDLPPVLKCLSGHDIAKKTSKDIFTIPIHQGMTPQNIIRHFATKEKIVKNDLSMQWIENNTEGEKKWRNIIEQVDISNIPQDWTYGSLKQDIEGWKVKRAEIISREGETIGVLQILIKKKANLIYAVRVNRGPVFKFYSNTPLNNFEAMELLRREIPHPIPIIYAANVEMTPSNLLLATQYGWKVWNLYGFPSGIIDLRLSEKELRKNLNSKWRNQLVSSEKHFLTVYNNNDKYFELLNLYESDQIKKKYYGIPINIMDSLFKLEDCPLETYYVLDEKGTVLAFDIFYRHAITTTYLVGWNSLQGRALYLNNLLLYNAMISLKGKGLLMMDLGGIEFINTESVAKFKEGLNCKNYRLMGEFIKL